MIAGNQFSILLGLSSQCHNGLQEQPIFCNEEDKLPSLSLCFWVTHHPHPLLSKGFLFFFMKSFVRAANCCFCDVTQTKRKSKHWSIVGYWWRFGDHQILCGRQDEQQLNHKLTCVYLCVWRSINDYRALVDYHAHDSLQRQITGVNILIPKQTSQSYILQKV